MLRGLVDGLHDVLERLDVRGGGCIIQQKPDNIQHDFDFFIAPLRVQCIDDFFGIEGRQPVAVKNMFVVLLFQVAGDDGQVIV